MCKGKKSLDAADLNVDKILGTLHRAKAFEMQTCHFFQHISSKIEWIGVQFNGFIGKYAKEELGHASKIDYRFMELGTVPTDAPLSRE
jgi:hypothetical protein